MSTPRRFFADSSFWNQPIPADVVADADSARWTGLLHDLVGAGVHVNIDAWTVPVYEADAATPRHRVGRLIEDYVESRGFVQASRDRGRLGPGHPLGHGPGFGAEVPIPDAAVPDRQSDSHLAVVDWTSNCAWDMWAVQRGDDGAWRSCTGMTYALDGPGQFDPAAFPIVRDESIHLYGPSRASGVPLIAGLIMHHEIAAGRIAHKLAIASERTAYGRFAAPAIWTDGWWPDGIPQGAVLQLDPRLDLARFGLSPAALTVARCLQEYGAVMVDVAGGCTLYAEGLWNRERSWRGVLGEEDLRAIGFAHWRVLRVDAREGGFLPLYHRDNHGNFRCAMATAGRPVPEVRCW